MVKYIYTLDFFTTKIILPSAKFAVSLHDDKASWKKGYNQALKDVVKMNRIENVNPSIKSGFNLGENK